MTHHTIGVEPVPERAAKQALRTRLLAARRSLAAADVDAAAEALVEHLPSVAEVRRARTVAAYVSVGREPGTGPLLRALHAAGQEVLLPVLLPDGDLDWARHDPALGVRPGPRGLLEPAGERLGTAAVTRAEAVLLPGLAADRTGVRLGRGGGSYDRVLARLAPSTFSCVLLHRGELLETVPAEPHDRRVAAAATVDGLTHLGAG